MPFQDKIVITRNPAETMELAAEVARELEDHAILALRGDMGSGKTCFVRGLAFALGIECTVNSPTFTIVNEYRGHRLLYHVDLYRLTSPEDVLAFGFEELLETRAIIAIEWAENARDLIPDGTIDISLKCLEAPDEREIIIRRTRHTQTPL
jgi:tRNA threonylcarbamoyladenosine biosynthesis protein TsaE